MVYQYLPIKLAGGHDIKREDRLKPFDGLIGAACCDFIGVFGLDCFVSSYVYITAKHLYQGPNATFNRPGWHCDGFMTDDINYIWSDTSPTVFNVSPFELTQDDILSMEEMEEQAESYNDVRWPCNELLRLDQFCVHRAEVPDEIELRTFVKISFSRDRYDLIGNSHNDLLTYSWPMRHRSITRNIPQAL